MEIEQTRDTIVKKLTVVTGRELEIMANITSEKQIAALLEGLVDKVVGDTVGAEENDTLLRASISRGGRGREDLTTLGRVSDKGWKEGDDKS